MRLTVFSRRPPLGESHQFARRVIAGDDTLCSVGFNRLENDRREDPLPAQGPQAEQGGGFTGAGRRGCDRDVYRFQGEQQEQSEQNLQQSQVNQVTVHSTAAEPAVPD